MTNERQVWLQYSEEEDKSYPVSARGVVIEGIFKPLAELIGEEALGTTGVDQPTVTADEYENEVSWQAVQREAEYRATLDLGDY